MRIVCTGLFAAFLAATSAFGQTVDVAGSVRDETGGMLPGVTVDLHAGTEPIRSTFTDTHGGFEFSGVAPGRVLVSFSLINFGTARREVTVSAVGARVDIVLHLALNADVTVTGKRTFANLADAGNPVESLVGFAQSASQGAITARQLETRPISRAGEVLETVPGLVISQHSGEGKANQYYLRGFNLDHGTDFATTVAGLPANMPTHAHGQGYSDLNFLIPELVSGVQFSKGPYFADQGDFATAGAANINYANVLDRPIVRLSGGSDGYGRALFAESSSLGSGQLLAAVEVNHDDGPWVRPDAYEKINSVVRYSAGDAVNGFSITAMGYHGRWSSTDQIPQRAVAAGLIGRFGGVDSTDGGHTYRYSLSGDWQRGHGSSLTRVSAYGLAYDLGLFSNFTYFLNDPVRGDQMEQADHRFVSGAKLTHQILGRWAGHAVKSTFGVQLRNDDITTLGLYHTQARTRLGTVSQAGVMETSGALFAQNELQWTPWLRTQIGVRADQYRFRVDALEAVNSGKSFAGLVTPRGGLVLGPWKGTEFYANAGDGYHSNDARGTTITRGPDGNPAERVTPLVRATGSEVGVRTVAIPHVHTTLSVWSLRLASELVFAGDAGTTESGRPSERHGVEWASYVTPRPWLIFDGDVSWSRGRFRDDGPAGTLIPGSVQTVVSLGATVDSLNGVFGSLRLRYFGPRPLIEDGSIESKATNLVNADVGYKIARNVRLSLDVFNLLNSADSDIDYYYTSRLPGEPLNGVNDVHLHPALPRTARVNLVVGF